MLKLDEDKLKTAYKMYCQVVVESGEPPVSYKQYKEGIVQSVGR